MRRSGSIRKVRATARDAACSRKEPNGIMRSPTAPGWSTSISQTGISATGIVRRPIMTGPTFISKRATSIRLNPTNAASYVKRADVWRAKGNLDSALNDLEHATRISPNMAKMYANRGLVDEARGDIEQAKADYQAALSRPDVNRQGFIDSSKREKDNAKARPAVLSDASVGASPQAPPPSSPQSPAALPAPAGRRIALVI